MYVCMNESCLHTYRKGMLLKKFYFNMPHKICFVQMRIEIT